MKTALVIVALMVVIVAVQAGGGRGKCDENKLKKKCGEKKEGGEGKGKGRWKNLPEDCKEEKKKLRAAACAIFNADNAKVEDACAAMKSPVWEKCIADMKAKKGEKKEGEKKSDEDRK